MSTLAEKRVYGETRDATVAYVAAGLGLTRVDLAGDRIGRFSLIHRGETTAVAADDGRLVVGTPEDVLVGTGDGFAETGFGPAVAVAIDDGRPLAAAPGGRVGRLDGDDWHALGTVEGPRRLDGDLLAAAEGVFQVGEGLTALGEPGVDVRDVAAAGPYAATAAGLSTYDGGWAPVVAGDAWLVAAAGDRAVAVVDDRLRLARDWDVEALPVGEPLADVAVGSALCAVTADGTVLVRADPDQSPDGQGGWRSRALGVGDPVGLAVL